MTYILTPSGDRSAVLRSLMEGYPMRVCGLVLALALAGCGREVADIECSTELVEGMAGTPDAEGNWQTRCGSSTFQCHAGPPVVCVLVPAGP
jgi:hypothetical protein